MVEAPAAGADNRTIALRAMAAYLYDAIDRGDASELTEEPTNSSACVALRIPEQVLISRELKMPKAVILGRPINGKATIVAIYRYNITADKLQRIG